MVATGHTYDKECIERWLAQGHRTCPVTGQRLRHLELVPNFALRNAIQVGLPVQEGSGLCCAELLTQRLLHSLARLHLLFGQKCSLLYLVLGVVSFL